MHFYKSKLSLSTLLGAIFLAVLLAGCAASNAPFDPPQPQLPKQKIKSQTKGDDMLNKRFGAWKIKQIQEPKNKILWAFDVYKFKHKKPWYGSNLKPVPKEFFDKINKIANLENLGKESAPAITIATTSLRALPSLAPLFIAPTRPGEGFPFDYLQISTLPAATPVFISHYSSDGAWVFGYAEDVWGWMSRQDIKILSQDEARAYAKRKKWLSVLKDDAPIKGENGEFLGLTRVGMLLSLLGKDERGFYGEIYSATGRKRFWLDADVSAPYPLELNDTNTKAIISSLMGQPYGWGGLGGLRDCSLFTRDFLAGFGYWLPRNSKAQSAIGERIKLAGLSKAQKLELIASKAQPYRTLIHAPGHIMLYVGLSQDKEVLVLHDVWGLRTYGGGRAIIGKISLTTLLVGSERSDVPEKSLLINRADYMNILP